MGVLRAVVLVGLLAGTAHAQAPNAGVERALEAGKYEEAEKLLDSVTPPEVGAVRLELLNARGLYDEAIKLAQSKAFEREDSERWSLALASALAARGQLERAEAVLKRATREPGNFRAQFALGAIHDLRGNREDAERVYYALIAAFNDGRVKSDDGAGLSAVAQAARALGATKDANQAFKDAVRAAPEDVDIERAWVELFLEKYDVKNAERGVARILAKNPRDAAAIERLARIRLETGGDFAAVEKLLSDALAINPNLVAAHVSRAGLALRDMDLDCAEQHLNRALAVNPRDLEALSVRAAVKLLADDTAGFERALSAVLRENPRFSRAFSIIATYAEWEHRYDELVTLAERALRIDPEDVLAHATRGLNLLRTGNERAGLLALEEAWSRDRYNVRVFNTLNLYEEVIAKDYVTVEHAPFTLRMSRAEKPVLEGYASGLLSRAYNDMKERYAFAPKGPLSIEMYANEDHFSVRTSGLPRLGVQGVCFGKVVTLLSPRAQSINWGQVMWHELSHVFHVQLSKSRVPRWFTEGLAEYETAKARPEWKREDDRPLWDALEAGELPKLADLNHAFTHAQSPEALMIAYYGSTQAVSFLIERHGFGAVPRMLKRWGEGASTAAVFKEVLGKDVDAIDAEFKAALRARLSAVYEKDFRVDLARFIDLEKFRQQAEKKQASAQERGAYALALANAKKFEEANALAAEVLSEAPAEKFALFTRAHLALVAGKAEDAEKHLTALLAAGHESYQVRMLLARLFERRSAHALSITQAEEAIKIDPNRPEAYDILIRASEKTHDEARLLFALERYVAIDQHSKVPMHLLLEKLWSNGKTRELVKQAENALYVDPESPRLHYLFAEALVREQSPERAIEEATLARSLATEPSAQARAELVKARAELQLSRREKAKASAQRAVELDPSLREEAAALFSR